MLLVTEQEVAKICDFVTHLNSMEDSVIVVEGKRDADALRKIGFTGKMLQFYRFGGMVDFADSVAQYRNVIILFDRDRKGRQLTGKMIRLLSRRTRIDLTFRNRLGVISMGRVRFTEQLRCYEPYLF